MTSDHSWSNLLPGRRDVCVEGRRVFEMFYSERIGNFSSSDSLNGVVSLDTVDQYESALVESYSHLTASRFRWKSWQQLPAAAAETRHVATVDLGPNFFGAAITGASARPYMTLSNRAHEVCRERALNRRKTTVAHEMVHLLQFETEAFRFWPDQGYWGEGDPNWWLHEATARAVEARLYPDQTDCWALFWDWATQPENSIDSDPGGMFAAPLMLYLMQTVSDSVPADIYALNQQQVDSMRGCDMIARALENRGLTLAATTGPDVFASGYCVAGGLEAADNSGLPSQIGKTVGPRVRTDVFSRYPVRKAAGKSPINHLGCRYFEFRSLPDTGRLEVSVLPDSSSERECLRGELVPVLGNGQLGEQVTLKPSSSGDLRGAVSGLSEDVESVLLVVANCGYGEGWMAFDGQTFSLNASLE
jgi:hypothetical protein